MDEVAIISLALPGEAFRIFTGYVEDGILDFEGKRIEADFGDYTHVIHDENRIKRVSWIEPTAQEPDEVWLWRSRKPSKRQLNIRQQTYVKWIRPAEEEPPELFVLGVELLPTGQLRLRSWYSANNPEAELEKLGKGEQLYDRRRQDH